MRKLIAIILTMLFCTAGLSAHIAFDVRRALIFLEKGDLESAEKELYQAWFSDPDNFVVNYNLGVVNYRKRDFRRARQYFARAAALNNDQENRFNSLYSLGNSAFKAHDFAAAVEAYKSGLELKKDTQAEHNLKVALEKLASQEQQQKQDQEQENNQDQKKGDQEKDQQNKQGKEKNSDQGDENSDNSGDKQDQKNEGADQENQQQAGKSGDENEDSEKSNEQAGKADESSEDDPEQKEAAGADEEGQADEGKKQELADQNGNDDTQNREDLQMPQQQESEKRMPEASQRAHALKNMRLNPYMVEKVLKDMENREREAQLRARNENVRREDEADPFTMDARELREWFEKSRRPAQPKGNEPDW